MIPRGVVGIAANIVDGDNPSFTADDFRRLMPEFTENIISAEILNMYINMAHAVVKEARWFEFWKEGMRLFVAHFATLFLDAKPVGEGLPALLSAAGTKGVASSKSVGAVSVSYDVNAVTADLEGWANWKQTVYGTQYATLARMLGKGGMYVR